MPWKSGSINWSVMASSICQQPSKRLPGTGSQPTKNISDPAAMLRKHVLGLTSTRANWLRSSNLPDTSRVRRLRSMHFAQGFEICLEAAGDNLHSDTKQDEG